jgi:hypothetical protein
LRVPSRDDDGDDRKVYLYDTKKIAGSDGGCQVKSNGRLRVRCRRCKGHDQITQARNDDITAAAVDRPAQVKCCRFSVLDPSEAGVRMMVSKMKQILMAEHPHRQGRKQFIIPKSANSASEAR